MVSEPAVLVVAGVMPIDLMAEERRRVYTTKEAVSYTHLDVYKRQVYIP